MNIESFNIFGNNVVIVYEISVMSLVDDGIIDCEVVVLVFSVLFVEESFEIEFRFRI